MLMDLLEIWHTDSYTLEHFGRNLYHISLRQKKHKLVSLIPILNSLSFVVQCGKLDIFEIGILISQVMF